MLSLLAKFKSSSSSSSSATTTATAIGLNNASNTDSAMDVVGLESSSDPRQELLDNSQMVDEEVIKLQGLLQGDSLRSEDLVAVDEVLEGFNLELDQLEDKLLSLELSLQDQQSSTDLLLNSIHQWIRQQLLPETPVQGQSESPSGRTLFTSPLSGSAARNGGFPMGKFSTPLRHRAMLQNASTPRNHPFKDSMIDFDAFPQTPTLEDIGLSQSTLAAVGAPRKKDNPTNSFIEQGKIRSSLGSVSEAISTPKISYLNSSNSGSNFGSSGSNLASRISSATMKMSVDEISDESMAVASSVTAAISSTPTVVNRDSPFGFNVFGGRPSSTSYTIGYTESEL